MKQKLVFVIDKTLGISNPQKEGDIIMHHRLIKFRFLLALSALLTLAVTVAACGSDEPAAAPVDVSAVVQQTLAAQEPGISSEDVSSAIASALKAQEPGISSADVSSAIASALKAQEPGLTQKDITTAVSSAVEAALDVRELSADQMARAVSATAPIVVNENGKHGGTLHLADYVFPNLDFAPYTIQGTLLKNVAPIMGGGLIEFNGETEDVWDIRGDLADSWIASDDLSKYVFKLNKGATWHDGTPVTADDVVWSFDLLMEPDPAIRPNHNLLETYLPQGSAKAIGPNAVQLSLELASAEFLPILAMSHHYIHQQAHTEAIEAEGGDFTWGNQMGSGPFTAGEKKNDVSIELLRNENYWKDGLHYVDKIISYTLPEGPSMLAAYATGQVHANSFHMGAPPFSNTEAVDLVNEHPDDLNIKFLTPFGPVGLIMSVQAPFDDVRMRQAYNLAFDRHEFVEVFGAGPGSDQAAPFFGADTYFGFSTAELLEMPGFRRGPDGEKHPDDIAEAKRLIASWEADHPDGFTNTVGTDTYTYTPGQPHSFTTMTRISGNKVAWAELAMEQLNRFLDFDATLIPIDSASGIDRYNARTGPTGSGDFFMAGQDLGMMMLPNSITSTLGAISEPITGWNTMMPSSFKASLEAQKTEADPAKRVEMLRELQRYLIEEDPGPLITLYQQAAADVWSKKLINYNMPPTHYGSMVWEHVWIED